MSGRRTKIIITATGIVLMSAVSSFAINDLNIKNDALEFYVSRYSKVEEVKKYLEQKGIQGIEYETYVKLSKKYRYSKERKWEDIENGSVLIDTVLFTNKLIKEEYDKRLETEKDETKVYNSIKKDIINNPSYVLEIIKEAMDSKTKMKEAFKLKYERIPTEKEMLWLLDENNIKYALYGGELGREITERECSLIQQGYGYRLLGLKKAEVEEYTEYILIRDKIAPLEVTYYNSVEVFEQIYQQIHKEYKVNIYECLTEDERLEIHSKSVNGIIFNQEVAYKRVVKKLKEKGIIKDVSQNTPPSNGNGGNNDSIAQDSSSSNPNNELNQYLKENNSSIRKALLSDIKELYASQKIKYSSNLKNTYIYFKYKDKVVNTYIRMSEDEKLTIGNLAQLIKSINESLGSKMIFSVEDTLILIENEIKVSKVGVVDQMLFQELVRGFKTFGIELYEKEIIEEKEEPRNPNVEKSFIRIDLKEESYEIPTDEDKHMRNIDFKKLLEMMEMRYVFTTNSILILKEGKIHVIEIDAYNKGFVTAEDVKLVLDKVGIDAVVNTIIRREN